MKYFSCLLIVLTLCSCSSDQSSFVFPGETLDKTAGYFLIIDADDDRELYKLLEKKFVEAGYVVTSGMAPSELSNAKYIISYGSQWQWDITWYLLELELNVYSAQDNLLVATASSQRTSLVRKSSEGIINEVFNQIFNH